MSAVGTAGRTRVLIAAENAPTRVGLRLALEPEAECTEAGDRASAVAAAVRERPDVCLLDIDAPGGLRAVSEIVARVPGAVVIVLTRHAEEDEFLAAMRAGAVGYLPQGLDPARLPFVVRSVLRGEAAVPRNFVSKLIDEVRDRGRGRRSVTLSGRRRVELTSREWEALELLRQGMSTREIATDLRISQVTVRRHLSAAYHKLGVGSRLEALGLMQQVHASRASK
jgi:DNA-binding NarL/FixJ family response regulator